MLNPLNHETVCRSDSKLFKVDSLGAFFLLVAVGTRNNKNERSLEKEETTVDSWLIYFYVRVRITGSVVNSFQSIRSVS